MAERSAASRLAAMGGENADDAETFAGRAGFGPRILAFLVDSLVLFGFTMVFATAAGLVVFVSSDFGEENPSDGAFLALVVVLLATVPGWLLLTGLLYATRRQTVGQYVFGLMLQREDGTRPSTGQIAVYLLALHPLVYHPIFAGLWALLAYEAVVIVSSTALLFLSIALVFLSLLAPLVNLVFALAGHKRGIHDRLAGLEVVEMGGDE